MTQTISRLIIGYQYISRIMLTAHCCIYLWFGTSWFYQNSKRWDYSDTPDGGHKEIKRSIHMVEGSHHFRKAPNPHPLSAGEQVIIQYNNSQSFNHPGYFSIKIIFSAIGIGTIKIRQSCETVFSFLHWWDGIFTLKQISVSGQCLNIDNKSSKYWSHYVITYSHIHQRKQKILLAKHGI